MIYNYKYWKFTILSFVDYANSGDILESESLPEILIQWDDIIPESTGEITLEKILQDFGIAWEKK